MGVPLPIQIAIAAGVGALGTLAVAQTHLSLPDVRPFFDPVINSQAAVGQPRVGCNIKGNISIATGERIYHVPGQKFYDATVISPQYDERWFCTEAEARAAGWRKARR